MLLSVETEARLGIVLFNDICLPSGTEAVFFQIGVSIQFFFESLPKVVLLHRAGTICKIF